MDAETYIRRNFPLITPADAKREMDGFDESVRALLGVAVKAKNENKASALETPRSSI